MMFLNSVRMEGNGAVRWFSLCLMFIFLNACFCLTVVAAEEVVKFITNGEPVQVYEQGKLWRKKGKVGGIGDVWSRSYQPWYEMNGELVGIGSAEGYLQSKQLLAGKAIGAGDFHVKATLSIDNLKGSGASFVINNNSHFEFSDSQDFSYKSPALCLEGPFFGEKTTLVDDYPIKEGQPFAFELIRKGDDLRFLINNQQVYKMRYDGSVFGAIGFRPWYSTMRIRDFSVTGETIDLEGFYTKAPEQRALFVSGEDGYHRYKIPALIITKKGTLLAFCEGRHWDSDAADIEMLLKRSEDGGKTWSKQQVVWDDGSNTCGNPCPVVDQDTGTIWLLMCRNNNEVFVTHSTNDGKTWSKPVDITETVKRKSWHWYATGPGVGIQIRRGQHNGRLVIPCDHRSSKYGMGSHAIYSDDRGKTWKHGEEITPGCNECQVVELVDGTLMMNLRSYNRKGCRAIATSKNGGDTWSEISHDADLIEPVCQASFLRYSLASASGRNRLLFSNPANTDERIRLIVRMSYDEGKTWPEAKLLYAGPSAYSCLAVLPDGTIGCLYEAGIRHYQEKIFFARFNIKWLTDGRDNLVEN